MDGPVFDVDAAPLDPTQDDPDQPMPVIESCERISRSEDISLEDLVAELEGDPGECWRAFQGLESIELVVRLQIIKGLAQFAASDGVVALLQVLAAQGDEPTREAALKALGPPDAHDGSREIVCVQTEARPVLVDSLVTTVDGGGRGAIGLSARRDGWRATAIFLCDVERGVQRAIGQVEEESDAAGELLREFQAQEVGAGLSGVGELALRLLAGALSLNGTTIPDPVSHWLEQTMGSGFEPQAFRTSEGEDNLEPTGHADFLLRAHEIIKACPTWLDRSRLTYEMAEEIVLREGRSPADPRRDSGAFRYLFEHRIMHRLEQYGRMLLWMSRFWESSGERGLARSAEALALQLADEQYAVPSHPFTVALTALSLNAAQERLGTESDPRARAAHSGHGSA